MTSLSRRSFLSASLAVASSAALASHAVVARAADATRHPAPARRPEADTPYWLEASGTPGLAIALIEDGKTVDVLAFGTTGGEGAKPIVASTIFQAASLSKQALLLVALAAVDAGKLDLDRPLTRYMKKPLGEPEADLERITARHVLTHTSGWPNWPSGEGPLKPVRPLGAWGYSGAGFLYLQQAMESIWGEPATATMQRLVFDPLGMESSSFVWKDAYESTAARGYESKGEAVEAWRPATMNGASSLHTTAGEFARLLGAFLTQELRRAHPQVYARQVAIDARLGWSLGWGTAGDVLWQWGHTPGFKSFAALAPARGRGIVTLTNGSGGQRVNREWVDAWLESDLAAFYFRDIAL